MINESCVETSAAPEWLSKLESRREKLTQRRLGHESGAGAPCNVCGEKCPGLDLHFWRKVCRNCKCRKEQHECGDDDLSGWAQFEILGQIRSKPAYINIKTFADQPVKLDWVPPNVESDLVTDYMTQLGSKHIPIAGSDAAAKRKQQLEYQVPPHDLDPTLCDNLTENEQEQLKQYVDKIKESCVGQGNIVRIEHAHGFGGGAAISSHPAYIYTASHQILPTIQKDKMATFILNSEVVKGLLQNPPTIIKGSRIESGLSSPMVADYQQSPILSETNKIKLNAMKINSQAVQSGTVNGPFYDGVLRNLRENLINYENDHILKPMDDFRREYLQNNNFSNDVDRFVHSLGDRFLDTIPELDEDDGSDEDSEGIFKTPKRPVKRDDVWNSPVHPMMKSKQGQLMQQETPMRKINLGGSHRPSINMHDIYNPTTGLPILPTIKNDPILSNILNSDVIQGILNEPALISPGTKLKTTSNPLICDFEGAPHMSPYTKEMLKNMKINTPAIESGVLHGWAYDKIFPDLQKFGVDYYNDTTLKPIEEFRKAFAEDEQFRDDVLNYVENLKSELIPLPLSSMNPSKSNDSGFESIPPTPNFSTFPGGGFENITAQPGIFQPTPGISSMNMYPAVAPSSAEQVANKFAGSSLHDLSKNFNQMNVSPSQTLASPMFLKCQQCTRDILPGDVAVKAERAGKDVAWHPQCFVCSKCDELLADLVYFFHGGKVYCARDLADILKIPRCNACDELIFTKEYTAAEGATFHIKHFCCYQCDKPLAGQQYLPDDKNNMPLCLSCYDQYYAEKCQRCHNIIGPMEQGVSWGKIHWHGPCFICAGVGCAKSLIGGRFCVKNDLPFCSPQCVRSVLQ